MKLDELLDLMENEKPKPMPPKQYKGIAYVERCLHSIIDGIESDDWSRIAEFIVSNLADGNTVVVIDNTTEERNILYPENLIEGGI